MKYSSHGISYFEIIPFLFIITLALNTDILSSSVTNHEIITSNRKRTQHLFSFFGYITKYTRRNIVSCLFLILNIIGIVLRFAYLFLPVFIFIQSHLIHLITYSHRKYHYRSASRYKFSFKPFI